MAYEHTKSGCWRKNLTGQAAFWSFVPSDLNTDIEITYTDALIEKLCRSEFSLGRLNASFSALPEEQQRLAVQQLRAREAEASWELSAGRGGDSSPFAALIPAFQAAENQKDEMDLQEIQHLADASEYAVQALGRRPISGRLLKNVHALLSQSPRYEKKYPGEFRRSPNWLGAPEATLRTADFVPPTGEDMDHAFSALERYIHDNGTAALIKAALIHYQFETIHPFIDGNGRVGRILNALFLIESGRLPTDVLLLSNALKLHSAAYYKEIERVQRTGIYENWIAFFLERLQEAAEASDAVLRGHMKQIDCYTPFL